MQPHGIHRPRGSKLLQERTWLPQNLRGSWSETFCSEAKARGASQIPDSQPLQSSGKGGWLLLGFALFQVFRDCLPDDPVSVFVRVHVRCTAGVETLPDGSLQGGQWIYIGNICIGHKLE